MSFYLPNPTYLSHRPHTPDLPPYRLSRSSSRARSRAIQPRAGDARWGVGDVAGSKANRYRTPLYWHGSALRNNEYNIVSYMYITEEGTNPLRALPLRACPPSPLVITRYGVRKGVGARSQLPLSIPSVAHDYTITRPAKRLPDKAWSRPQLFAIAMNRNVFRPRVHYHGPVDVHNRPEPSLSCCTVSTSGDGLFHGHGLPVQWRTRSYLTMTFHKLSLGGNWTTSQTTARSVRPFVC